MQRIEARIESDLQGTGLTVRMRAVLEALTEHGPQTVPDIAFKLEIQRQYVQLMVNDTIKVGLAEKQKNPRHARSPLIALTKSGLDQITRILEKEGAILSELTDGLSADDIATALRVARHCHSRLGPPS
ncbi:MarR family winged helix-turn-helix transcriptional regulator [Aliiroseovarius halocynthiae]|nr:MarR family winged helix-turn-helix transcriptional regulator [Aliiroseovarius halocynthiae]